MNHVSFRLEQSPQGVSAKRINAATLLKDSEYSKIFVRFMAQVGGGKGVNGERAGKQQHATSSGAKSIGLSSGFRTQRSSYADCRGLAISLRLRPCECAVAL